MVVLLTPLLWCVRGGVVNVLWYGSLHWLVTVISVVCIVGQGAPCDNCIPNYVFRVNTMCSADSYNGHATHVYVQAQINHTLSLIHI